MMRSSITFLGMLLATTPAWAEKIAIQPTNQPTSSQLLVSLNSSIPAKLSQHGTLITVSVPADMELSTPDLIPRNVVSAVGGPGSLQVTVLPGVHLKWKREKRTLILNLLDAPSRGSTSAKDPSKLPAEPQRQAFTANPAAVPAPSVSPAPIAQSEPQAPQASSVPSAPTESATVPPMPVENVSKTAEAPPPAAEAATPAVRSFTVNAAADTGMAAFRFGSLGIVIFDANVELAGANDGDALLVPKIEAIQRGTMMTISLAGDEGLAIARSDNSLTVAISAPTGSPAVAKAVPTGIQFQVSRPGRVMAVSDPVSGQILLVGTTRQTSGEHARVDVGRSAPGYELLPTWLGLAVKTNSDRIDLKASLSGYTLSIADQATANATAAAQQENQFGIPNATSDVLVRQLNAQIASASAAPVRARGIERVAAARTMLALGMSAEAEALLSLAATDDPAIARDPSTAALTGIAAVLAGRPADATGLDDPALPTGGDIALWRGLRDAIGGKPAPSLAGAWPLLSAYPEALRRQIAPPVMEAAVLNGADIPEADLAGPTLALARALKLSHDGQTDAAVAALTEVKNGRDDRASVQAAIALAELRLRTGSASAAETAEQLERQTIRWRGDSLEFSLQLRVAELRTQAGQWRSALDGLRNLQQLFPDRKKEIASAQSEVFRSLVADGATVPPLELVLIAGEFADSLPMSKEGDRLAAVLAEKLAALDLPDRAIPVLETLIAKSQSPVAKAEYGLKLAVMQLDAGNGAAAEQVLSSLDLTGMPRAQEEVRTMLVARAKAAQQDFTGAATILLALSSPEADGLRATYYARAGDWQRSLDTLDSLVSAAVPETGDLTDSQQDLVLREATAAVQAGNADAIKRLSRFDRRITSPRADLFRVLTASAVRGPDDLPRAARELAMSKTLPERINALKTR